MAPSIFSTRSSSVSPSMPGRRTSLTTIPLRPVAMCRSACSADSHACTSKPASSSVCVTLLRTGGSSSTKTILNPSNMDDLIRQRKIELEGCALFDLDGAQSTAEFLNNVCRYDEAQPQPFSRWLGGEERLEQAFARCRRNARAGVADANHHAFVLLPRTNGDHLSRT